MTEKIEDLAKDIAKENPKLAESLLTLDEIVASRRGRFTEKEMEAFAKLKVELNVLKGSISKMKKKGKNNAR